MEKDDDIPLADTEPSVSLDPIEKPAGGGSNLPRTEQQLDSMSSTTTTSSSARARSMLNLSQDELEEKERFITQILELQNTLDELSSRIDKVKDENLRLSSENQVLGQYIENLMSASSVFQSTGSPQPQTSGGGGGGGGSNGSATANSSLSFNLKGKSS